MDLSKILKTSLVGAGIGAAVGATANLIKLKKHSSAAVKTGTAGTVLEPETDKIINLPYAPDAQEAVARFQDYRTLDPQAFQNIKINLDRLVGLYLLSAGPDKVHASYEIKASRYRHNIQQSLRAIMMKYQSSQPSKQLEEDSDNLLKIVDNYIYNLSMQMKEKWVKREVTTENTS